ncbi:MAG TPA: transglutaminase-like domain-containing protein [Streptosporangiaceae bacterium]|nr:transglutaminase-like domain-containing protein [Streptosporangiaceae bacterium]
MKANDQRTLAYYTQPAAMTSPGRCAPLLQSLPRDIPGLAAVAQGLLIHEHMAHAYGVTFSEADLASVHIRPVEHLLEQIVASDDRPLHVARTPAARLPGNCRHFTVLMTAMLRVQGIPARARCRPR